MSHQLLDVSLSTFSKMSTLRLFLSTGGGGPDGVGWRWDTKILKL